MAPDILKSVELLLVTLLPTYVSEIALTVKELNPSYPLLGVYVVLVSVGVTVFVSSVDPPPVGIDSMAALISSGAYNVFTPNLVLIAEPISL